MYRKSLTYRKHLETVLETVPDISGLKGKACLVTGASGMIGSMLADVLLHANELYGHGITVYAVGRSMEKLQARFCSHLSDERLHLVAHDVTEPLETGAAPDYIIHAAGNAHPAAYAADPVGTLLGNVEGMKHMLELARKSHSRRVMFVSSGEVYGQLGEEDIPITEGKSGYVDPTDARSCYPSGKRAAETLCVAYAQQHMVDTVIVRPSHVYGPTATKEDSRASTQFINRAARKQDILMKSDGLQQRSYCYVADCVSAILTVLLRGRTAEAYNIAGLASNVTVRELADKVSQHGGVKVLFERPEDRERKGYTPITRAVLAPEKLMQLGWSGRFDIDTGIRDTLTILRETGQE